MAIRSASSGQRARSPAKDSVAARWRTWLLALLLLAALVVVHVRRRETALATVMRATDAHEAALWRAEGEGEERTAALLSRVAAPDVEAPESPVPLAGATEVVTPKEVLRRVRRLSGAFQLEPEYSRGYLLGGVEVAFDAVGSKQSLETALHATRAGGRVVLSGMPAAADLSAAGHTVIAVSHDMRFVAEAFERIVVMRDGRIVLDGAPAEVFAESAWPVLASTFLEPPLAARIGARLGLGSTPTDEALIAALAR